MLGRSAALAKRPQLAESNATVMRKNCGVLRLNISLTRRLTLALGQQSLEVVIISKHRSAGVNQVINRFIGEHKGRW